ncbi:MAG: nickel-dependent hydrogenase large subunit [Clostridiales bacterium]|nr:nickel-dependent hydrogenase large subunit [Clostridiales bacterium]
MTKVRINPLTRAHGYMAVEVDIQNGEVVDAWSSGLLFRGFEAMLKNRSPHDAVYLTQRICGICSSAHAMASSIALENAFDISVPKNGYILRNLTFGADMLQNHLRNIYLLVIPDYITAPGGAPGGPPNNDDIRLPKAVNDRIQAHYLEALETSDLAHKAVAAFGGKAPHLQSIIAGGVTEQVLTDRIMHYQSLVSQIHSFVTEKMIPDIEDLSRYYDDYFNIGRGYGNLLSFGMFPVGANNEDRIFKAGVLRNGQDNGNFDPDKITQDIARAWYRGDEGARAPFDGESTPFPQKADAYSWIKAPRYGGEPFEGGPLARMWFSGIYKNGISVMDRLMARAIETKEIAEKVNDWIHELVPDMPTINWINPLPASGEAAGLVDSMRGTLAHWIRVQNHRIAAYRIITPSAWNLSPRDGEGRKGPVEEALIGTPVANRDNPVEVGRVIRSFDPCISCAVHVLQKDGTSKPWRQF